MRLVNWLDKDIDITLDNGYPSKVIEDLLSGYKYKKTWIHKDNKYIIHDLQPFNLDSYNLNYKFSRGEEAIQDFKFVVYLLNKAVDYINNLNLVYNEKEEPIKDIDDWF